MSLLVKSEFATLLSALEVTAGTQAATGWRTHSPKPGGLSNFYAQIGRVSQDLLSSNLMAEKGDIISLKSAPSITQYANKDFFDYFGEGIMRSATKFKGATGVGRWQKDNGGGGVSAPTIALTGVTSTGYTVASGGAIAQNLLVYAHGFTNTANNGLKVVSAGSIGTEVKTSGLVVEAAPPVGAMLEIVGVQGASGDIQISAGQHITTTALDCTTLGLQAFDWVWIGGGTSAAPGALGFATAADRGFAQLAAAPTATSITLQRRSQTYSADTGAGKTIQIFFGYWLRNVNGLHADYRELAHSLELGLPGAGAAGATSYLYPLGSYVGGFKFESMLQGLATVTLDFVGKNFLDPTTTRATQAANAMPLVNNLPFNTVSEERRLRFANIDESGLFTMVEAWTLNVMNNAKPQNLQGTLTAELIFGDFDATIETTIVCNTEDVWKAVRDNRTAQYDACFRSNDSTGVLFDVPAVTLSGGNPTFAANDAVKLSATLGAHRDSKYNYILGMTVFPFLPSD